MELGSHLPTNGVSEGVMQVVVHISPPSTGTPYINLPGCHIWAKRLVGDSPSIRVASGLVFDGETKASQSLEATPYPGPQRRDLTVAGSHCVPRSPAEGGVQAKELLFGLD